MKKILLLAAWLVILNTSTAHATEYVVSQSNQQFSEDSLKIKAGDTIVFTNADTVNHNIQVVNSEGDTDDKGLEKPGGTIRELFSQAGEYKVRCGIHPGMKLKVSVH